MIALNQEAIKVCLSIVNISKKQILHGNTILCPITGDRIEVVDIGNPSVGKMCEFFGYIYIIYADQSCIKILDKETLELICEVDPETFAVEYIDYKINKYGAEKVCQN
jgi:hypothetical protein